MIAVKVIKADEGAAKSGSGSEFALH